MSVEGGGRKIREPRRGYRHSRTGVRRTCDQLGYRGDPLRYHGVALATTGYRVRSGCARYVHTNEVRQRRPKGLPPEQAPMLTRPTPRFQDWYPPGGRDRKALMIRSCLSAGVPTQTTVLIRQASKRNRPRMISASAWPRCQSGRARTRWTMIFALAQPPSNRLPRRQHNTASEQEKKWQLGCQTRHQNRHQYSNWRQ